ncbi:MAG: hybrid sensor histidine kinase/response regulator [Lysobacteraceae bacterium]
MAEPQEPTKAETNRGTVLVVDDHEANLDMVELLLGDAGYQVLRAANGPQALQLASAHRPDLILLDMIMPQMDGLEVCRKLKSSPTTASIPVIFFTASQQRDLMVNAFQGGAVDFIFRPFIPEELLARVGTHLSLKLTRDRLERIAREREDLVNLVAHDLKNPLSSILFTASLGVDPDLDEPELRRLLGIVAVSATDALGFIRLYLEQRAQGATRPTIASTVCLAKLVDGVVERELPQLSARGMQLRVEPIDPDACVRAEPMAVQNALQNLLSNAAKYAMQGGVALVFVRRGAPGFWQLCVSDRGCGIPRGRQQQLFQRFMRLVEPDPGDGLSSGLGLALTKQAIEGFGGHLWYEDRPGGGASFIIDLPAADVSTKK